MIDDRMLLIASLLLATVLLVAVAVVMLLREAARRDLDLRVQAVVGAGAASNEEEGQSLRTAIADAVRQLGNAIRSGTKLYSDTELMALEGLIAAAGHNPRRVLPLVLGSKLVLMVLLPINMYIYLRFADLSSFVQIGGAIAAAPIGLLIPDWIIAAIRRPHVRSLRLGVADALDLLVVCTEAGMGLESALEQVAREMMQSNRSMATALSTLGDELRVLPDRRVALNNFGTRSGVEGIRRMATMLAQSLHYGTPLGSALRAVAGELRRDRLLRLEEKAVRLPVLMVFPLIFFIMPSLFIVMGGIPLLGLLDVVTAAQNMAR